ncbi:hypothetical protein [Methanococcoides sp. LMO-2]|uniref:ArsR family transcriptional regulator n=1 Tax=Methanococcoides cohabitans TaxID=3136559 RepID=A0ABU9KTZ5_9EURY
MSSHIIQICAEEFGLQNISSLQRGVLKVLSNSESSLSLEEILHSLSKRPCAKKLVPQVVQLKKSGLIVCEKVEPNCMDSRYELSEKLNEILKNKNLTK